MYSVSTFILHFICSMAVIITGVLVNRKLYKNIVNEEHLEKGKVIQRIMKTYSIIQCFSWPLLCTLNWLTSPESLLWNLVDPAIMRYLFISFSVIHIIIRDYVAFNSLIIALCRYAFTVFSTKSEKIGIKRMRKVFITCSIAIPTIGNIFTMCTKSIKEAALFYGFPEDICQNDSNSTVQLYQGPTLNCENTFLYNSFNDHVPLVVVNVMNVICDLTLVVIYSNVAEAFIYAHTFRYSVR